MTFVLAVAFRYEELGIRISSGQAKVAGTLLGIAGVMLLTCYKGADITPWHTQVNLVAQLHHHQRDGHGDATTKYALGAVLCVSSCFFYALWLVVQAKLSSEYPFHYSSTALMCAMKLNIRLLSCAYSVRSYPYMHTCINTHALDRSDLTGTMICAGRFGVGILSQTGGPALALFGTMRHYVYRAVSGNRTKLSAQAWHYGSLTVPLVHRARAGPWLREKSRSSLRPDSRRRRAPPLSYSQAGERVAAAKMRLRRRRGS